MNEKIPGTENTIEKNELRQKLEVMLKVLEESPAVKVAKDLESIDIDNAERIIDDRDLGTKDLKALIETCSNHPDVKLHTKLSIVLRRWLND